MEQCYPRLINELRQINHNKIVNNNNIKMKQIKNKKPLAIIILQMK